MQNWRVLEQCVSQNERFSKHGRYFSPFFQALRSESGQVPNEITPLLMSFPFLDWTIYPGAPPAPRAYVDPQAQFQSSRSSSHPMRSMLQYFYRLEDTDDREREQVFTNHRPWLTDPLLQSKVERWYGQPPTGLNVDEMWVLVVDDEHIVTFSSNQTWKPRWPPHQVSSRIADIAFRSLRNNFRNT